MSTASRSIWAVVSAAVWLSTSFSAQSPATARVVEQFYPQRLVDLGEQAAETVDRRQCYAVLDTLPSGSPRTIVAGYTNTSGAAIRVLQADATGQLSVAAEPQGFDFFGSECKVELVDLDHDGRNDIVVTFGMMVNEVTWVFKWDGQQLLNLTPVTPNNAGLQRTLLHNADIVDIDNDGIKEIFVVGQYPPPLDGPATADSLYRLSGDRYVKSESIVGLWTFERQTAGPDTARVQVPLPKGALGPYTLHVVNGEPGGKSRVTSAQVWLNDQQILAPSDFGNKVDGIDRAVTLNAENELAVRLAGAPGSKMLVLVKSKGWE